MPKFGPIKRNELIRILKKFGFKGPFSGGNYQFMIKENQTLYIPNPHRGEISKGLLLKILTQAKIKKKEWEMV